MSNRKIILASSSPFRKQLLERLHIEFEICSPNIDESRLNHEAPTHLVKRLAQEKAQAVSTQYPDAIIIGSDQVAELEGDILGKPGNHQNAVQQLTQASGKWVHFHTGLCVLDIQTQKSFCEDIHFSVLFRQLTPAQIERYLQMEQPYNAAGSFKSEGLGISLFEKLEGDDPTALIGLPLIALTRMFNQLGIAIP
ncbi:MAG: septum formation inhibitor Maf [Gammaproteobacteria bacterium]|nr:septum formation inhibitor Maf [Gammaproteobacteria bacterium]